MSNIKLDNHETVTHNLDNHMIQVTTLVPKLRYIYIADL